MSAWWYVEIALLVVAVPFLYYARPRFPRRVTVVLHADTEQFRAAVRAAGEAIRRMEPAMRQMGAAASEASAHMRRVGDAIVRAESVRDNPEPRGADGAQVDRRRSASGGAS